MSVKEVQSDTKCLAHPESATTENAIDPLMIVVPYTLQLVAAKSRMVGLVSLR